MISPIAALLPILESSGLSILKGVVQHTTAKGVQTVTAYVKDQTGIDLTQVPASGLSTEETASLKAFEQQNIQALMSLLASFAQTNTDQTKQYVQEMQSARYASTVRDTNTDPFVRRFIYLLAITYMLLVFAFLIVVMIYGPSDPADPRVPMMHTAFGVLVGSGLMMILSFFYGSSKSSMDKNESLQSVTNQLIASAKKEN